MILKIVSKYGLAAHLGLLAAFPIALSQFLDADTLGGVLLWLSLFVAIWVFFNPSVRLGEHSADARMRVLVSTVRDPAFYFFVIAIVFAVIRWLNSGIALWYDAEQSVWTVKQAAAPNMPASTLDAGFLPMTVTVALSVVVVGMRHALGLSARIFCGLTAVSLAGLGGLVAAVHASLGTYPGFLQAARANFLQTPFAGTPFGLFLILSVALGAVAECRKWSYARIPYVLAVAGTSSGLVFFAPPAVVCVYLLVTVLFASFAFAYCVRVGSLGGFARTTVLTILGLAVPALLIMALAPSDLQQFKLEGLDIEKVLPVEYAQLKDTLSRISKAMWLERPWCGTGVGAFGLHVPFLAAKADWAVLPPHAANAISGYWTLLAERGIVGCSILAVGLGILLWSWGARLVEAFLYIRDDEEADVFIFACQPVVWIAPIVVGLAAVELIYSNDFASPAAVFAFMVPLVLSAASFPRNANSSTGQADNTAQDAEGR